MSLRAFFIDLIALKPLAMDLRLGSAEYVLLLLAVVLAEGVAAAAIADVFTTMTHCLPSCLQSEFDGYA